MILRFSSEGRQFAICALFILTIQSPAYTYGQRIDFPAAVKPNEARQQLVRGKVTDSLGTPVAGVAVQVDGTRRGTTSNAQGDYRIRAATGDLLVFRSLGFRQQMITVAAGDVINVMLYRESADMDEVVVTGYGQRSRRDVTTAISSIASDAIEQTVSMTPEMAMQGRMTGVQVAGNSGNPMMRPTVRIRGINTWGISSPLYVIDGMPVTEFGAGIEGLEDARVGDVRGPLNIMTLINPHDIESISVLKDASAAAIYGVRAANGVILITTKKGQRSRPSVDFSIRNGIQNIAAKADVLSTPRFVQHTQKLFASDPAISMAPENVGLFDPSSGAYLGNSPTYDWQDALLNKNASTQDYSLRISGGSSQTDYYLSGGYTNMEGTVAGNHLSRYNGAFNLNSRINKWIKLGANYRITSAEGKDRGLNYWEAALTPPWQPIYDPDGPGGYAPVVYGLGTDGIYRSEKKYGSGTRINHLGLLDMNDQRYESLRHMGSAYVELTPVDHLTITGRIGMDRYTTTQYQFEDYRSSVFDYTAGDPRSLGGGESVGAYAEREALNHNLVKEVTVNYRNVFDGHSFDVLLNAMEQHYNSSYKFASTAQMTTTSPYIRNLGGENPYTSVGSSAERWALAGVLGRIGYNYRATYYLDMTLRRDGSARFSPEHRWGWFPAASAAWRVTEEGFARDIQWLNELKLRFGWGRLGNQEVRNLAYLSRIETNPTFAWGHDPANPGFGYYSTAAVVFDLANADLQWETTTTTNIGMDATLFGSMSLSLEYYDKLTDGILQIVALPNSAGLVRQPVDNVASVRNRGVELIVGYQGKVGELAYGLSANLTTVRNRVMSTYKDIPLGNIEKGYPLFYQRGYKVGGIFRSQDEVNAWLSQHEDAMYQAAKIGPGDLYFKDLRGAPENAGEFYSEGGDGEVDNYDLVYLGKTIPGYFYGGSLNLRWRSLDFNMQLTGVGDVVKYNNVRASLEYTGEAGRNVSVRVLDAWTPENNSSSTPRIMAGDPAGNFRNSDYFVESAAYLRLSNMQLGYTLPQPVYDRLHGAISSLRLCVGSANLFTITKYSGLDPESDAYPTPRTFFLGLKARF